MPARGRRQPAGAGAERPAESYDYHLFVIGGGSGGVRAARIAAGHGARVALAEEDRIGGTCVIRGCVPKKLMAYASRFADDFEDAVGFGWDASRPEFSWPTLIANKDREIDRLNAAYTAGLTRAGVTILPQRAELVDAHHLRLADGSVVSAQIVLVATGGHANTDPQLPGHEHAITSDAMFHLGRQPKRIAIVGGSYVAIEFASIMKGLGSEVHLVYRGDEILRGFDGDLRARLHAALLARGIKLRCNDVFTRIEKTRTGLVCHSHKGATIEADEVLLAIGRTPNTHGIGLERAGVETDGAGAIMVDHMLRTTAPNIYAIGDVTNRVNLTPVAIREGQVFADRVFGGRDVRVDHSDVPHAVFGTPEAGAVGLTEETAREDYAAVDIYRTEFRPMKHTLSGRDEKMLIKLVVDAATDRLLGFHVVGPDAAELTQLMAVAIKLGATKAQLDSTMALHPTVAEEIVTMRTPAERHRRAAAE